MHLTRTHAFNSLLMRMRHLVTNTLASRRHAEVHCRVRLGAGPDDSGEEAAAERTREERAQRVV